MKTLRLITCLRGLLSTSAIAQTTETVTLKLKTNGFLPPEFQSLERTPVTNAPNVFTAYILTEQVYSFKLPVGTSLAQVNQTDINATMRGRNVSEKLLLVMKSGDDGMTVNLVADKKK